MLRLLIASSLAAWFVACASAPRTSDTVNPPPGGVDPARTEIETLDNQISDQLVRLEIQMAPSACAESRSCSAEPPPAEPTCTATVPACDDTCSLGESICKNATRICELAKQLGGLDTFANEKCMRGTESCAAARERCCNCKG